MSRTLTETEYAEREYFETTLQGTTDGLFSVPVRRLKKMVVVDSGANGQSMTIVFKDKPQKTVGP